MLPPPPGATSTATAAAPATPSTGAETEASVDEDKKAAASAIKQFCASEDADGNPVPVPTPAGVDMLEVVNEMYTALAASLAKRGITDVEGFIETAEGLDKTIFPGNKAGRVSYNGIRAIANIFNQYALLNKQRGVGGAAALKAKVAEKESRIAELEKMLAELKAKLG